MRGEGEGAGEEEAAAAAAAATGALVVVVFLEGVVGGRGEEGAGEEGAGEDLRSDRPKYREEALLREAAGELGLELLLA